MNTRQKKKFVRKYIPKWVKHIDWNHCDTSDGIVYGMRFVSPKHPIKLRYRNHVNYLTLVKWIKSVRRNTGACCDTDDASLYYTVKKGIDMDSGKLFDNLIKYHGDVVGPGPLCFNVVKDRKVVK